MTTYYVDPEGGNDANAGTSFALRKKTIAGVTAAMLAPGDTVRLIASRDPNSTGVNATWTNGSKTVTLASALTQTIENGEVTTGWVASSNVAVVNSTTATRKRLGNSTGVARFDIVTAFTTGKIAYKPLASTLDLSAFQQVSCWFWSSGNNVAGSLELRLCSDATGDTVVHTIPLTEATLNGVYKVVVKDFGAALGTTINSISLYANTDPGAVSLQIQNIIACKAAFGTDTLTHLSLIKPAGGSEWYPIASIDGTSIYLGAGTSGDFNNSNASPRNYQGSTVTSALWKLQPIDLLNGGGSSPPGSSTNVMVQDVGTFGNDITYSGGWDRTAMSSQSGETWLSGSHWAANAINVNTADYITIGDKIAVCHTSSNAIGMTSGSNGITVNLLAVVGCANVISPSNTGDYVDVDIGYVNSCDGGNVWSFAAMGNGDWTVDVGKVLNVTGAITAYLLLVGTNAGYRGRVRIPIIDGCGPIPIGLNSNAGRFDCGDIAYTNGGASSVFGISTTPGMDNYFSNCSPAASIAASAITTVGARVFIQNDAGDANAHKQYGYYYTFTSDQTTRHTASGMSWKLSCGHATNRNSKRPIEVSVGHYYASANQAVTIKCWMQRSSTSLACGIRVKGGSIAGVAADTSGAMSAAINTWEEVQLTVTPTQDGCIEIMGYAYGAAADCYFDDLSVST